VIVNNTPHPVAEAILIDAEGREQLVVALKATFEWDARGNLRPVESTEPVRTADVYAGKPESSDLLHACQLTLRKPAVDVLVTGDIVLARPAFSVDCSLEVGSEIAKTLRVHGDRYFLPSASRGLAPSRAKPFWQLPISWTRSFGGADPAHPDVVERRNPIGCGLRRKPADAQGLPAPNFEDPRAPVLDPFKRPAPVGFGAIAPHWQPRGDFAGTYDAAWKRDRYPLLPRDFDPRFLNAASPDQQLAQYRPGAMVRLINFTASGLEQFRLPPFSFALTVVEGRRIFQTEGVVDTVILEPAKARLSVVARAIHVPQDVAKLATAFAGPLSRGQRRALEVGKPYLRLRG
jgi:hypothetical protein